jgi:GcrA cell cycle regulator
LETTGGWTDERVELLKKLWLEGLSASQIAGVLGEGVTRNAVIGKVHRLKLSGRARPASTSPRPRAPGRSSPRRVSGGSSGRSGLGGMLKARTMVSAPMHGATALKINHELEADIEPLPQVQELFIPVEQRISLLQLNEHTCKWPIGDPLTPDFYFCGRESEEGHPYCEFHSRRAYHQVEKRKR